VGRAVPCITGCDSTHPPGRNLVPQVPISTRESQPTYRISRFLWDIGISHHPLKLQSVPKSRWGRAGPHPYHSSQKSPPNLRVSASPCEGLPFPPCSKVDSSTHRFQVGVTPAIPNQTTMQKLQVRLPESVMERLRDLAAQEDRPVSEVARRVLQNWVGRLPTGFRPQVRPSKFPTFSGGAMVSTSESMRDLLHSDRLSGV